MSESCCSEGSCETTQSCGPSSGGCPCGTSGCSGDPMDCVAGMWTGSYFEALKQLQVEALKARLQKAFGAKLEKAADGVAVAMAANWQAMVAQSKAKADLRQRLAGVMQDK